jgi:hypothetical protein
MALAGNARVTIWFGKVINSGRPYIPLRGRPTLSSLACRPATATLFLGVVRMVAIALSAASRN